MGEVECDENKIMVYFFLNAKGNVVCPVSCAQRFRSIVGEHIQMREGAHWMTIFSEEKDTKVF